VVIFLTDKNLITVIPMKGWPYLYGIYCNLPIYSAGSVECNTLVYVVHFEYPLDHFYLAFLVKG
jgi:hypothetical protein